MKIFYQLLFVFFIYFSFYITFEVIFNAIYRLLNLYDVIKEDKKQLPKQILKDIHLFGLVLLGD